MGRILIVASRAPIRGVVRLGLIGEHHEIMEAVDAEEALQLVGSAQIDLVIIDMDMPKNEGPTTIAEVRRTHGRLIKVIAISGSERRDMETLTRSGAIDRALPKPIGSITVRQSVR